MTDENPMLVIAELLRSEFAAAGLEIDEVRVDTESFRDEVLTILRQIDAVLCEAPDGTIRLVRVDGGP